MASKILKMLYFNAFNQIANNHTPSVQVQVFMLQSILLSPQLELRGLHSLNQEKMPLKLSLSISFFRSKFLCVSVLLLESLPSNTQLSLHLDKNVRGCALLLLYFLSDLYQLKLCLIAQHSPSYEPSFPCVLVHISVD